ncbi:SMC-Scp complex subunit ScpB [Lacticaseibacillus rhamnosus]|uniref:SMC-Scp complex subunit ScpB n=1 Tax=Lacticaseibacillus rhamnosus TaxID=47715 RepID=UPI0022E6700A|nr:SMC-Scp complex subunit ScpB [Lacticaseibacillus rhamnosus]
MEPVLEAILYTAGESGVTLGELASILEISESAMRQQLEAYQQRLAADDQRGLQVQQFADRYYLLTKPVFVSAIKKYFAGPPAAGLSQAALEVLAIIAYQQPITRIEIDEIRGVQSSGALTTLASRQLIKEAGRKEAPGRPILYATTQFFLDYFGLNQLADLPPLADAPEDTGEVNLFTAFRDDDQSQMAEDDKKMEQNQQHDNQK